MYFLFTEKTSTRYRWYRITRIGRIQSAKTMQRENQLHTAKDGERVYELFLFESMSKLCTIRINLDERVFQWHWGVIFKLQNIWCFSLSRVKRVFNSNDGKLPVLCTYYIRELCSILRHEDPPSSTVFSRDNDIYFVGGWLPYLYCSCCPFNFYSAVT